MTCDHVSRFALGPVEPPEDVLQFAAILFLDTLAVAAGAAALDAGRIARDHAVRFLAAPDPRDRATLLFDGRWASIPGAAFATATQIDNLDAHDGLNPTKGHIGCALVPALCAFAETRPDLSARDAMIALVAGYEVAARAAIALHATVKDYHTSGAWNGLGVAVLGCRLRGLGPDVLRHAFGMSEYHGPRSQMMREIANPTMLHDGSGMGALVGAMSVLQAEDGFTGAPAITVEEAAAYWADLGRVWTVPQNYVKPYPICRWAHAALDALAALMNAHRFTAKDVTRIEVRTFKEAAALFPDMPDTTSQAQYSLSFALATLLVRGRIGPSDIVGPALCDPQTAQSLTLIHIEESDRHSRRFPQGRWSDVTVTLTDGRVLCSGDVHARGGPEAPMALSEIAEKFDAFAMSLAPERRAAIWSWRDTLLRPDRRFADLLKLLHPAPEVGHG